MGEFLEVADVVALPAGQARTVEVRGRRLALANVDGQFHAVDDIVPAPRRAARRRLISTAGHIALSAARLGL